MKRLLPRFLLAAYLAIVSAISGAQELPIKESARESFERGLLAAQQKEWRLALRYFKEAYEKDRDAPQVWFNLGLAAARLPGAELRASAWLRAYLFTHPQAANAKAVQDQVDALELQNEVRVSKLLGELETMARQLRWDLSGIVAAYLYLGDKDSANRLVGELGVFDDFYRNYLGEWQELVVALSHANADSASRLTEKLKDNEKTWLIRHGLVPRHLIDGNMMQARQKAQQIPDSGMRTEAWIEIACKEHASKNAPGVNDALKNARQVAVPLDELNRANSLRAVYELQVLNGAYQEAMNTLERMPKSVSDWHRTTLERHLRGDGPPPKVSLPYSCRYYAEPLKWLMNDALSLEVTRINTAFGQFEDYQVQDFLGAAKTGKADSGATFSALLRYALLRAKYQRLLKSVKAL